MKLQENTFSLMSLLPLEIVNPHPRDKNIEFEEKGHRYTITIDGIKHTNFMSVTSWVKLHFMEFDSDDAIVKMKNGKKWDKSKYKELTDDQIKKLWEDHRVEASELGTNMHFSIEQYYNHIDVGDDSKEFKQFLEFDKKRLEMNMEAYKTEWKIYDEKLNICGTPDMLYRLPNGNFVIYDWKRSSKIKKFNKFSHSTTECIKDFPNTNFWHYTLQLNMYKYILEHNYGINIVGMYLGCFHPDMDSGKIFKVQPIDEKMKSLIEIMI